MYYNTCVESVQLVQCNLHRDIEIMKPSHPELSKLGLTFSHGDLCGQVLWSQSDERQLFWEST